MWPSVSKKAEGNREQLLHGDTQSEYRRYTEKVNTGFMSYFGCFSVVLRLSVAVCVQKGNRQEAIGNRNSQYKVGRE
jgi:hypothetical protein